MPKTLQAEGKVLSQRNATRLKSLFSEIGSILTDAKVISPQDLKSLIPESIQDDLQEALEDEDEELEEVEAAGIRGIKPLAEAYALQSWEVRLHTALTLFKQRAHWCVHCCGKSDNPSEQIQTEIKALHEILSGLAKEMPIVENQDEPITAIYHESGLPASYDPYSLSSSEEPEEAIAISDPIEIPEFELDSTETVQVEAESQEQLIDLSFDWGIDCESLIAASSEDDESLVEVEAERRANKIPFTGILFRMDEPSESSPSKGSDYPLFISRTVAEPLIQAIASSGGLPIDVDDTLSKHSNPNIAGVMTNAEIQGSNFVVHGHLFPWSQKEKVGLILANQKHLGMSMNALANGVVIDRGGRKVFEIRDLELLGANVLFKDRATYQKTNFEAQIAASSSTTNEGQDTGMGNAEMEVQLSTMNSILNQIAATSQRDSARIDELTQSLQTIQAERREKEAEIEASRRRENEEMSQKEFLEKIGQVVDTKIKDAVNPRRAVPPISMAPTAIAAQGQTPSPNDLEKKLIAAQAKLSLMEEQGITGPGRIALTDEVSFLKNQLGVY
jgi:hypothetical protein